MSTTKAKKPAETADVNALNEAITKADTWVKDSGEKLREAATKATEDLKVAGNIAIEGEVQATTKLFQLAGDLLNARAAATLSILKAPNLQEAFDIEQSFVKDTVENLNASLREVNEIRYNTLRDASQTYSARAHDVIDGLSKPKAA